MANASNGITYSDELESLMAIAIEDGKITDKEKRVLTQRAVDEGIDPDEFEMVLEFRLQNAKKSASKKGELMDAAHQRGIMSAEKLNQALAKAKGAKERVNIIKDFPIPSAPEDLLEFIMTMSAKAKNETDASEKEAYIVKYDEACLKAKTFYSHDNRFAYLLQETKLSSSQRRTKDSWVLEKIKENMFIVILWIVFFILLIAIIACADPDNTAGYLFFYFLFVGGFCAWVTINVLYNK